MAKVVVGWAIASSLFLAGWLVGVAKHRRTCEETLVWYARRVVHLEQVNADLKDKVEDAFEFGRLVQHEYGDES